MRIQQRFAFDKTDCGLDRGRPVPLAACEPMEHFQHCVYTGQDMGLAAAKGRQTKCGQTVLQRAHIPLTQRQIVEQIAGAPSVGRMHGSRLGTILCFQLQHIRA
jgi:hypothetical protein